MVGVGAIPGGTRASIADNEEGHSKAGEATRTVGTGNQNGGDGRACAWEAATTKGDGLASQPRRYWVPGQPLLHRHQVGGVSRSPDGLFAQQEREPIRGQISREGEKDIWWMARTARGGTGHLGLTHTETQRGRP